MLGRMALSVLSALGADSLVIAATTGGVEVVTRQRQAVVLRTLIQLDGDIVTFVDSRFDCDAGVTQRHYRRVARAAENLIASLRRLGASLLTGAGLFLLGLNLPGILLSLGDGISAFLMQIVPAGLLLINRRIRRYLFSWTAGPLLRWLLRDYGRHQQRRPQTA